MSGLQRHPGQEGGMGGDRGSGQYRPQAEASRARDRGIEHIQEPSRPLASRYEQAETGQITPIESMPSSHPGGSGQKGSGQPPGNWGLELKSYMKKREGIIELTDEYLDNDIEVIKALDKLGMFQECFRKLF